MITIGQILVTRSGLSFRYDYIRSDRNVTIESTIGCQSDTIITIGLLDLGRCGTRIYEGCPSKYWTFVITRDCLPVIL